MGRPRASTRGPRVAVAEGEGGVEAAHAPVAEHEDVVGGEGLPEHGAEVHLERERFAQGPCSSVRITRPAAASWPMKGFSRSPFNDCAEGL